MADQVLVEPLDDRAEEPGDRSGDVGERVGAGGLVLEGGVEELEVGGVAGEEQVGSFADPPVLDRAARHHHHVGGLDQVTLDREEVGLLGEAGEGRPVVHAVVDHRPAEGVPGGRGQRVPSGDLDDRRRPLDAEPLGQRLEGGEAGRGGALGLGAGERIEAVGQGEAHLPEVLAQRGDRERLAARWEVVGDPEREDPPTPLGPAVHHLLGPLPAELPVDDREAHDVVGRGGRGLVDPAEVDEQVGPAGPPLGEREPLGPGAGRGAEAADERRVAQQAAQRVGDRLRAWDRTAGRRRRRR